MTKTQMAHAAVAVGHGTAAHLVQITRDADGNIQQEDVSCGSKQQRGWTRSRQWGNEILTEFTEQIVWFSIFDNEESERAALMIDYRRKAIVMLEAALPAFIEYAGSNACSKCVKSAQASIKFMKGKVAA